MAKNKILRNVPAGTPIITNWLHFRKSNALMNVGHKRNILFWLPPLLVGYWQHMAIKSNNYDTWAAILVDLHLSFLLDLIIQFAADQHWLVWAKKSWISCSTDADLGQLADFMWKQLKQNHRRVTSPSSSNRIIHTFLKLGIPSIASNLWLWIGRYIKVKIVWSFLPRWSCTIAVRAMKPPLSCYSKLNSHKD